MRQERRRLIRLVKKSPVGDGRTWGGESSFAGALVSISVRTHLTVGEVTRSPFPSRSETQQPKPTV